MARQKLITQEILKNTPELGGQDGLWGEAVAYAKFFSPSSGWTWYMTEYDPKTKEAFGYVEGLAKELGPFDIDEFEELNDRFFNNPHPTLADVWVERDQYFKPTKLQEINPEKFKDEEFSRALSEYKTYVIEYIKVIEGVSMHDKKELIAQAQKNPFKLFNDLCDENGFKGEMFVCFDEFRETILKQLDEGNKKLNDAIEKMENELLIKNWYTQKFPDDEIGVRINPKLDWKALQDTLEEGKDVYGALWVGDSLVRERVFGELADRLNVKYDAVYNQWLKQSPGKIVTEKIERDPNQKYINFHMYLDTPYKYGPGWGNTNPEVMDSVYDTLNHSCLIDTNMILVEKDRSGSCPSAYNPDDEMEEVYIHPMEITGTLKGETIEQIEKNIANDNNPNVKLNFTKYFGECVYETPESYYKKLENLSNDSKTRLKQRFKSNYGVEGNILGNLKYYLKDCPELVTKGSCFCGNAMEENMRNVSDVCVAWCNNLYENTPENQEALDQVLKKNNIINNNQKYAKEKKDYSEPTRDAVKDSQNFKAASENKNIKNPKK